MRARVRDSAAGALLLVGTRSRRSRPSGRRLAQRHARRRRPLRHRPRRPAALGCAARPGGRRRQGPARPGRRHPLPQGGAALRPRASSATTLRAGEGTAGGPRRWRQAARADDARDTESWRRAGPRTCSASCSFEDAREGQELAEALSRQALRAFATGAREAEGADEPRFNLEILLTHLRPDGLIGRDLREDQTGLPTASAPGSRSRRRAIEHPARDSVGRAVAVVSRGAGRGLRRSGAALGRCAALVELEPPPRAAARLVTGCARALDRAARRSPPRSPSSHRTRRRPCVATPTCSS